MAPAFSIGSNRPQARNFSSKLRLKSHKFPATSNTLDDMCQGHMELPEHEFVAGCSFLRQVALGTPPEELKATFDLNKVTNFRDYDRRTGTRYPLLHHRLSRSVLPYQHFMLPHRKDMQDCASF